MDDRLPLRRHLYERAASVGWRGRRAFRKQLRLLAAAGQAGPEGGASGVREPRRPHSPTSPRTSARRQRWSA